MKILGYVSVISYVRIMTNVINKGIYNSKLALSAFTGPSGSNSLASDDDVSRFNDPHVPQIDSSTSPARHESLSLPSVLPESTDMDSDSSSPERNYESPAGDGFHVYRRTRVVTPVRPRPRSREEPHRPFYRSMIGRWSLRKCSIKSRRAHSSPTKYEELLSAAYIECTYQYDDAELPKKRKKGLNNLVKILRKGRKFVQNMDIRLLVESALSLLYYYHRSRASLRCCNCFRTILDSQKTLDSYIRLLRAILPEKQELFLSTAVDLIGIQNRWSSPLTAVALEAAARLGVSLAATGEALLAAARERRQRRRRRWRRNGGGDRALVVQASGMATVAAEAAEALALVGPLRTFQMLLVRGAWGSTAAGTATCDARNLDAMGVEAAAAEALVAEGEARRRLLGRVLRHLRRAEVDTTIVGAIVGSARGGAVEGVVEDEAAALEAVARAMLPLVDATAASSAARLCR